MFRIALSALILTSMSVSLAHAGVEGIGEPRVTWLKRKVHVCWKDGVKENPEYKKNDFTQEQKDAVKAIVEKEYTEERTGISFFGWENCADLPANSYDLQIIQDNELAPENPIVKPYRDMKAEGSATLGHGSGGQISTVTNSATGEVISKTTGYLNRKIQLPVMYLMVRPIFRMFFDSFYTLDQLQATALHEFGHVAGLRHEHILEEAKTDPNCKNRQDKNVEVMMDTAVTYESYDPNSIMNYCWGATLVQTGTKLTPEAFKSINIQDKTLYSEKTDPKTKMKYYEIRVGLSAKDISTLRAMYPKPSESVRP